MKRGQCSVSIALLAAALLMLNGCTKRAPTGAERTFKTPEDAVSAFVAALEADDVGAAGALLGPGVEDLLSSGDTVADRNALESFLRKYRLQHRFVTGGPNDVALLVGDDDWPLPIPIVRVASGWQLDGAAGTEELVLRRIGRNELHTIDVMHGFVEAQQEYAATGHDGLPAGLYAQRFLSQPGKHDGLYWETSGNEPPSPAGPLLAAAAAEGYANGEDTRKAYHGYVFRMLLAQGPAASGGAREYIQDGRLTRGFALLATPAVYGVSGVMTFMVDQDGVVWQRDLGDDTARLAAATGSFDPDAQWTPLAPEG